MKALKASAPAPLWAKYIRVYAWNFLKPALKAKIRRKSRIFKKGWSG